MSRILLLILLSTSIAFAQSKKGKLVTDVYVSKILKDNKINLDVNRKIKVYLPPNYETSNKFYPVVYFLHNMFWDNDRMFQDGRIEQLIDRAWTEGKIKDFIFVVPDYRSATTGSLYDNSPVNGRWLDYTIDEIIPFIDKKYRTIATKGSRAITGEFMGGRGALKFAMTRPDIFSVVYAMHPVATGMGELPWTYTQIDWKKIQEAKSFPLQDADGRTQIFISVMQTFLPNVNRPPLYCDLYMDGGKPVVPNLIKARKGFLLGDQLDENVENLRLLKGIAFDWGRFDVTYAHVDSNREFSRKLEDLGIPHIADEFAGGSIDKLWIDDNGRFYDHLLPFIAKKMEFEKK